MGNWVMPGLGDVSSYMIAGVPFVVAAGSGETKTANLKYVTSELVVAVSGSAGGSTIHFGDNDSTALSLPAGTISTFRVRTKKFVVVSGPGVVTSVCASITGIPIKHIEQHDQDDYGTVS